MPSKKGRIVLYRGRKLQLLELVRRLVASKHRPVCSADLRTYLAGQDEAEIGYIQSFGQILLKASMPRPSSVPRLHAVGIHKNRTYYTTELNAEAHQQFERFCASERAEYLLKRGYLQCMQKPGVLRSDLELAAAYSLRKTIESTLPYLEIGHLANKLRRWLENCPYGTWVKPKFHQVDRCAALKILKAEVARRAPYLPSMNFNRHLARVCPTILRGRVEPIYCQEVLRTYCATLWPLDDGNLEEKVNALLKWILVMIRIARDDA